MRDVEEIWDWRREWDSNTAFLASIFHVVTALPTSLTRTPRIGHLIGKHARPHARRLRLTTRSEPRGKRRTRHLRRHEEKGNPKALVAPPPRSSLLAFLAAHKFSLNLCHASSKNGRLVGMETCIKRTKEAVYTPPKAFELQGGRGDFTHRSAPAAALEDRAGINGRSSNSVG